MVTVSSYVQHYVQVQLEESGWFTNTINSKFRNTIDYVTLATTGDAFDFGDLYII